MLSAAKLACPRFMYATPRAAWAAAKLGSSSRARFWNGIDAASPLVRNVVMPMLNAFSASSDVVVASTGTSNFWIEASDRSEEHTSELQSLRHLVCRLL